MSIYGPMKWMLWTLMKLAARVEVQGRQHVPETGPALIIANHQSILDPILVQAHLKRAVHSMTKSTQFAQPFFRWLMPRILAFPTRRYKVDPQTVRIALRLLSEGRLVCIYPEGERSWDGVIQPLRRGTVRLALKAGVPVIPCGIEGSYDVWPRWSKKVRRSSVTIRYGEPIHFGRHDSRAEREAALPAAMEKLETALQTLSGASLESLVA